MLLLYVVKAPNMHFQAHIHRSSALLYLHFRLIILFAVKLSLDVLGWKGIPYLPLLSGWWYGLEQKTCLYGCSSMLNKTGGAIVNPGPGLQFRFRLHFYDPD